MTTLVFPLTVSNAQELIQQALAYFRAQAEALGDPRAADICLDIERYLRYARTQEE